jgi:hypothetical protein
LSRGRRLSSAAAALLGGETGGIAVTVGACIEVARAASLDQEDPVGEPVDQRAQGEREHSVDDHREEHGDIEHRVAAQVDRLEDPAERLHHPVEGAIHPLRERRVRVGAEQEQKKPITRIAIDSVTQKYTR